MPFIGITGGIASGKSTFAKELIRVLPGQFFDSDLCVSELLATDVVRDGVQEKFGSAVVDGHGHLNKTALRELVFRDPEKRVALEKILHPRVRERWTELLENTERGSNWVFVDIPLLFETGAEAAFDSVVLVACPDWLQRERLMEIRGLDEELAGKMILSQLDLPTKLGKAEHVIWNGGSLGCLRAQTQLLAGYFKESYGSTS